jgi:triosephosphate isomerase (TIM)
MRTPFLAANWKMYKTVAEAVVYAKEFRSLVKDAGDVEIVLAPPFTALHAVAEACRNTNVVVAGQNMSWEKEGAFTGEISGGMLKEAGAEYVIIGHSERRRLFGETDQIVNRKSIAAFHANLVPIVCIGETLEEREGEQTLPVLDRQLKDGLDGLTGVQVAELVIAYEPVWAIGTGRNATPEQANEAHAHIRSRLRQWFGADTAERCHVIYGGSVKPDNIKALAELPDVDGALVGGASLDPRSFLQIVTGSRKR